MALDDVLFTFCPPGPEDRLNEISKIDRGTLAWSKDRSHFRAPSISAFVYVDRALISRSMVCEKKCDCGIEVLVTCAAPL